MLQHVSILHQHQAGQCKKQNTQQTKHKCCIGARPLDTLVVHLFCCVAEEIEREKERESIVCTHAHKTHNVFHAYVHIE